MPSKPPTLKAMIIRTFASVPAGEPLTSAELADAIHTTGFDFGSAAVNDQQRIMLVEKVLQRLKIDGTLAYGTAGGRTYWHLPAVVATIPDAPQTPQPAPPLPTRLPERPLDPGGGRPLDDSGDHLLGQPTPAANRFAALFTFLVLAGIAAVVAIGVAMTPSQFSPRGENYDPARPSAPVATSTPPPPTHTVEDSSELPPDFVADVLQPPAAGENGCATVYGHSLDGTRWIAPYCEPTPDQP